MKNKKIIIGALSMVSLLSLASCDSVVSNDSSEATSQVTSETTSQEETSSSTAIAEVYSIVVKQTTGVTVTTDVEKAEKGTLVTVTLQLDENYSLNSLELDAGGIVVELTKVNDTTYTFIMPDMDVYISTSLTVEGDVTLTGDLALALEDEGQGLYVARNVRIEDDSSLAFAIKGDTSTTIVPVTSMNPEMCFADIDLDNDDNENTEFDIAGNAIYDFFYDTNDQTTYIQRVEIIDAPESVSDFESLFAGQVMSTSTQNPQGVNQVEYTNSHSHIDYKWDLYEDGSFATASNTDTDYQMFVYKNYDDENGIYSVVDTYLEGLTDDNGDAYDTTRADDNSAFSGKYQVVDNISSGYARYQKETSEVEFDSTAFSHDIKSLDFDMHYGYRTGFAEDELKYSSRVVDSTTNTDGSFTTTVETVKDYDYSTYNLHLQFSIEISFDKAGAPLSGSYKEVSTQDEDNYNFDTHEYETGGEASNKLVKKTSFTYSYGEAKTGEIPFDVSPYFVSEITGVTIDDNIDGTEGNNVNLGTKFEDSMSIEVEPSTALDLWQYGIDSSSDTSVVGPIYPPSPLVFGASGTGEADLVINNHTTKDVNYNLSVNVVNVIKARSYYFVSMDGLDDMQTASELGLYAGNSRQVYLYATPYYAPYENVSIETSSDEISVSLDKNTHILTVDATQSTVEENTKVTLTVNTPDYDTDFSNPSVLTVNVFPKGDYSNIVGEYVSTSYDTSDESITYTDRAIFSDTDSLTRDGYKQLAIQLDGGENYEDLTFSFDYKYIPSTGTVYIYSNDSNDDYTFDGNVSYDPYTGTAGICVYSLTTDWYNQEETDYLGYPIYDQDGTVVSYMGESFTRVI